MVELSRNQFAYLLAAVRASGIIGLDDPDLFPEGAKAEEEVFGGGRGELESAGWIQEVDDHPGEYQLDPFLLEMVAVIGGPEFVVAGAEQSGEVRNVRMIYIVGELAVELAPMIDGGYALGYLPDDTTVGEHMGDLFQLNGAGGATDFSLSSDTLEDLKTSAASGKVEEAARLVEGDPEDRQALSQAAAGPRSGRVVVLQTADGEVGSGRRAFLFGADDNVWIEYQPSEEADELTLTRATVSRLGGLVQSWLSELESQSQEER